MPLDRYRPWFYAAAAYNAMFGIVVGLFPIPVMKLLGIGSLSFPALFQCIGMIVGVYAIGYWLVAKDPVRYGGLAWVGLLGKALGPLGFLVTAATGGLPWSFGWMNLFNDVIWLPAFIAFLVAWHRNEADRGPMQ